MTDYIIYAINVSREKVEGIYAICSITGPVTGVVLGGIITNKLGGYDKPEAAKFTWFMATLASILAIMFPFANDLT